MTPDINDGRLFRVPKEGFGDDANFFGVGQRRMELFKPLSGPDKNESLETQTDVRMKSHISNRVTHKSHKSPALIFGSFFIYLH